ncbi:hypothetical protein I588_02452 [Enterococcus pallens ATCC BAA-351]|uniref:PTS EIIA type-4 domain-containing protein n=1 Tax=Enterococcus pallens ATCC BAA-351 TaxID=1158607 RepID=R2QJ88_9ENTE|nr:hypothetical protein UAU_01220 [Enterococcus pallens ATCC BAA-351]EOU21605.1 hypothetical protein I588_02452 [Enterococcus pallens ATCC BAA-351]OJG79761.1 hypothetical protein RV10_GL000549 [Enterococcus pallens]
MNFNESKRSDTEVGTPFAFINYESEVKTLVSKIILASHGSFASGIESSLKLICGNTAAIESLDCYTVENFDLTQSIDDLMERHVNQEIIVVTDIFGGSVNNEFIRYISRPGFYLVAGLNLPFLIELVTKMETTNNIERVIQESLDNSKAALQFCNKVIHQVVEEEEF